MISRGGVEAVRALALLAELPAGQYLPAGELARRTGAPRNYLGKLLHVLSAQRLLVSKRGLGGGVRLAMAPARITLFRIVRHLEPIARWSRCIMGRGACRAHGGWQRPEPLKNAHASRG